MKRFLPILCCVLCTGAAGGQTDEQKQQTVALLRSLQGQDGGFRPTFASDAKSLAAKSSLRASVAALRALKYFGGKPEQTEAWRRSFAEIARMLQGLLDRQRRGQEQSSPDH